MILCMMLYKLMVAVSDGSRIQLEENMSLSLIARFIQTLIILGCVLPMTVFATNDAGFVKAVKGDVYILRDGAKLTVIVGTILKSADTLTTGTGSSVSVTLKDGTMLSAGANSSLLLSKFQFHETKQTGELDATVKKGTLAVISGKLAKTSRETVVYRTPNAILGVRGTTFLIEVGEGEPLQ